MHTIPFEQALALLGKATAGILAHVITTEWVVSTEARATYFLKVKFDDGLLSFEKRFSKEHNLTVRVSGNCMTLVDVNGSGWDLRLTQLMDLEQLCLPTPSPLPSSWVSDMRIVRINAPEWYARPDFMEWLNHKHTATWHTGEPEAFSGSDVFLTYEAAGGSDEPSVPEHVMGAGVPQDIWDVIKHIVVEVHDFALNSEVLVWISNDYIE